jgi:hypothetical protein
VCETGYLSQASISTEVRDRTSRGVRYVEQMGLLPFFQSC